MANQITLNLTKPGEVASVMAQVRALNSVHRIHALATGELLALE